MVDESIINSIHSSKVPGLFRWAQLFLPKDGTSPKPIKSLDSNLLNGIFEIIDGGSQEEGFSRATTDSMKSRVENWYRLVRNMKNYYLEALQEVITMKPPNIVLISRVPKSAEAKYEVERILECLVCAAVRCERRDHFIHEIMHSLGAEVQAGIMETITSFTVDEEKVISLDKLNNSPSEWLRVFRLNTDGLEAVYLKEIYSLLDEIADLQSKVTSLQARTRLTSRLHRAKSLCRMECCLGDPTGLELTAVTTSTPRLDCLHKGGEDLVEDEELGQEHEDSGLSPSANGRVAGQAVEESDATETAGPVTTAQLSAVYGADKQSVSIELAEVRAKLRRTRAELEDQADQLIEVHDQLRETRRELCQVKEERARLADAAHNARHWQDEVDALREVADRAQLLDRENATLKKRLHEADYYKLMEDLAILSEERNEAASGQDDDDVERSRGPGMQELKKAHQRLLELEQLRSADLDDLHKLREELGKLRLEQCLGHKTIRRPTSITTVTTPEFEARPGEAVNFIQSPSVNSKPLSDQLFESVATKLHRLEAENNRLIKQLCSLGEGPHAQGDADFSSHPHDGRHTEKPSDETKSPNPEQLGTVACPQCVILNTKLMVATKRLVKAEEERNECLVDLRRQTSPPSDLPSPPPENACHAVVDQSGLMTRPTATSSSSCGHDGDDEGEEEKPAGSPQEGENVSTRQVGDQQEEEGEVDSGNKTGDSTEETGGQAKESSRLRRRARLKDRRYRSRAWLEAEIIQLEAEISTMEESNGTLKMRLNEAQNSVRIKELELQELRKGLNNAELQSELRKLKDSLRISEDEVWRLRKEVHKLESEVDEGKSATRLVKRLEQELSTSTSTHQKAERRLKEVEKEQAEAAQKLIVEKQTIVTLREELVNEKINRQHQVNLMQCLKSRLEPFGFLPDQINRLADINESDDRLESMRQAVIARLVSERSSELQGLQTKLQELRTKSPSAGRPHGATVQGALDAVGTSSPPVQLLVELKHRLAELEHENARVELAHQKEVLAGEETKTCVKHLEHRLSVFQGQLTSGQTHLADLIATNARLQVENTTMRSQVDSLTVGSASISKRCSELEGEANRLATMVKSAHAAEAQVATDYCHLQRLHEQLSQEYDVLNQSLKETKESERRVKQELASTRLQMDQLQSASEEVQKLKMALEQERSTLKSEARSLVWTVEECTRLRAQLDALKADGEESQAEKTAVLEQARETRRQLENEENRTRQLNSELEARRIGDQRLQLEAVELRSKVQMFTDVNAKLEKENQLLMVQLQSLLTQNQELLMSTMETCTTRVQEEGALRERLLSLQRQKQYFEERVMQQYRTVEPQNRNQKRLTLMQRARAVLSKRKDSSLPRGGRSCSSIATMKDCSDRALFACGESNDSDISSLNLSGNGSKRTTTSYKHLIPGSVSIFDRDPDECDASDIRAFLNQLNASPRTNKKLDTNHRRCGSLSVHPNRQRHQSSSLRLSSGNLLHADADKTDLRRSTATSPNAEVIRLSRNPSGAEDQEKVTESRLSSSKSAYSFHSVITYTGDSGDSNQRRQSESEVESAGNSAPVVGDTNYPTANGVVDSRRNSRYQQRSASQHYLRAAAAGANDPVAPVGRVAYRAGCTERLPATDRCEKRLCEVLTIKSTLDNPESSAFHLSNARSTMTRSPSARSFLSSPRLTEINHLDGVFLGSRSSNSMEITLPTPKRSQISRIDPQSDADCGKHAATTSSTASDSPQGQAAVQQEKSRVSLEVVGKPRVLLEYGAL